MKVKLYHRHYGVHSVIKEIEIVGKFTDYYFGEDQINEDLLLQNLPDGFLPVSSGRVLLAVQDISSATGEDIGSTGKRGLKYFQNWAKYFDSYSLELCRV